MGASRPPGRHLVGEETMHRIASVVAGLSLAFVGTSATIAATINVNPGESIQAAINASSNGDVINIAAGTYSEYNLNPGGKAITIQGTRNSDGSLATIIDGQDDGVVFRFISQEDQETILSDLMITGGLANYGGGIYCYDNSNPTISGCTIEGNVHNDCQMDEFSSLTILTSAPASPSGACCLGGTCMIGTEADCTAAGGIYAGDDVACGDAGCATPPVTGACCVSSGCESLNNDDCTAMGGNWLGEDASCDDCAPTCQGDANADGTVDVFDLLKVIDGWGLCD